MKLLSANSFWSTDGKLWKREAEDGFAFAVEENVNEKQEREWESD